MRPRSRWPKRTALLALVACQSIGQPGRPAGVTFLGDSIVLQLGALADWFGSGASEWVNAGVGGNTTAQLLDRVAILDPAITGTCVVLGGINDIVLGEAAEVGPNLRHIVEALRARHIRPVVITLLPVAASYPNAVAINADVRSVNDGLRAYAAAHDIPLIDGYFAFLGPQDAGDPGLYDEGLHPNRTGQLLLTATARPVLQRIGLLP
jgi:lysophospholipase L1-like esterase